MFVQNKQSKAAVLKQHATEFCFAGLKDIINISHQSTAEALWVQRNEKISPSSGYEFWGVLHRFLLTDSVPPRYDVGVLIKI